MTLIRSAHFVALLSWLTHVGCSVAEPSSAPQAGAPGADAGEAASTGGAAGAAGTGAAGTGSVGDGGGSYDADTSDDDAGASRDAASSVDAADDALDCDTSRVLSPGDHELTLQSANGLTYTYTVVVPPGLPAGRKTPLVVVWHALLSSPEETRTLTRIDEDAAEHAMIAVHPRSPDAAWDVGSCCTGFVPFAPRRDEEVFARELVAAVESLVCVDEQRIYTTGFSNGGMISQFLACKMADVFAAAAPLGSTLTIPPEACRPARPMPIILVNGTGDPLVGWDAPGLSGGSLPQVAFARWAELNQCTGEPEIVLQQGAATCRSYTKCAAGSEVTLCAVEGMGHCVPGMKKEAPDNCYTKLIPLGMPNDDMDGIGVTGDFMRRFALP